MLVFINFKRLFSRTLWLVKPLKALVRRKPDRTELTGDIQYRVLMIMTAMIGTAILCGESHAPATDDEDDDRCHIFQEIHP